MFEKALNINVCILTVKSKKTPGGKDAILEDATGSISNSDCMCLIALISLAFSCSNVHPASLPAYLKSNFVYLITSIDTLRHNLKLSEILGITSLIKDFI